MQDSLAENRQSPSNHVSDDVQAHLGQASKFANGKARNWSLFVFFRILSKAEVEAARRLFVKIATASAKAKSSLGPLDSLADTYASPASDADDLDDPSGPVPRETSRGTPRADPQEDRAACDEFRAWLTLLSTGDLAAIGKQLTHFSELSGGALDPAVKKMTRALAEKLSGDGGVFDLVDWLQAMLSETVDDERNLVVLILAIAQLLNRQDPNINKVLEGLLDLSAFGKSPGEVGRMVVERRLIAVCAYEMLRQFRVAGQSNGSKSSCSPPVRSERNAAEQNGLGSLAYDSVPINIALTYSGLEKLRVEENTLRSFPDVFREGMARRAKRLGDVGASAPENWEGELGLRRVHGYFTGGFQVGDVDNDGIWDLGPEAHWAALRQDIDAFNMRAGAQGRLLRVVLGALFRLFGMEVVHIELGQDPYTVKDGNAIASEYRQEHFGFRDGISQPFVDMGLGKPMRGGATPGRDGTWTPVAPGEIYLGFPDEDGVIARQPGNVRLRGGGTYLVFRKLEQDVAMFRSFLAGQRPGDTAAQEKLAAQFMGRWKDGTPLALAPDDPAALGPASDKHINDFLYALDDPLGDKCPLGSHARRCNPRDTGGRNSVRRNRILRRGIGYGGPLYGEDADADDTKKGLLFVAANARIDLQFEVIQADWMNRGEFLGQAGLGRCPIAGANLGGPEDAFHEAGANTPVTGIPQFVTTRGGDYFFAPGRSALEGLGAGDAFKLDQDELLAEGHSMGEPQTPGLFTERRVGAITRAFVSPRHQAQLVRVRLPGIPEASPYGDDTVLHEPEDLASNVCFLGKHHHVLDALRLVDSHGKRRFSVAQYTEAGRRATGSGDLVIGTELDASTEAHRRRLYTILAAAWQALDAGCRHCHGCGVRSRLDAIVSARLGAALLRTGDQERIDLVRDLAGEVAYGVVSDLYGTPGPSWVTELGIALPFARQHVGNLHPDWLAALSGKAPANPGFASMQIWSILTLGDVFGNVMSYGPLKALSAQAGAEMMNHLNRQLADAWTRRPQRAGTLLEAFVEIEDEVLADDPGYTRAEYHADVSAILFELIASTIAAIPGTFGNIMDSLMHFRMDLPMLFARMSRMGVPVASPGPGGGLSLVTRLIYEAERLRPNFKVLMRRCEETTALDDGVTLDKGEWVAALVVAANLDSAAFPDPFRFSLHPFIAEHPERPYQNYLLFGAATPAVADESDLQQRVRARHCWGRDAVALHVLERCMMTAARLDGLRRLAGEAGDVQDIAGATTGLWGRFHNVLPEWH